jgi:hypothetical protein
MSIDPGVQVSMGCRYQWGAGINGVLVSMGCWYQCGAGMNDDHGNDTKKSRKIKALEFLEKISRWDFKIQLDLRIFIGASVSSKSKLSEEIVPQISPTMR